MGSPPLTCLSYIYDDDSSRGVHKRVKVGDLRKATGKWWNVNLFVVLAVGIEGNRPA